jgi:hypothetical protein
MHLKTHLNYDKILIYILSGTLPQVAQLASRHYLPELQTGVSRTRDKQLPFYQHATVLS